MPDFACYLCHHERTRGLYRLDAGREIRKCRSCGLIAVYPTLTYQDVEERYEPAVFSGSEDELSKPSNRLKKERFEVSLNLLKTRYGKAGGRLLDFGCGMGAFMKLAAEHGFQVAGVDISPHAAAYVREQLRLKAFAGRLSDPAFVEHLRAAGIVQGQFDVITLWDVLHATYDPLTVLAELRPWLKDDGVVVVKVLNAGGLIFKVIGAAYRASFGAISRPVRLAFRFTNFLFSADTLGRTFARSGLRMDHVYTESHKDFTSLAEKSWGGRAAVRQAAKAVYSMGRVMGMEEEVVGYGRLPSS